MRDPWGTEGPHAEGRRVARGPSKTVHLQHTVIKGQGRWETHPQPTLPGWSRLLGRAATSPIPSSRCSTFQVSVNCVGRSSFHKMTKEKTAYRMKQNSAHLFPQILHGTLSSGLYVVHISEHAFPKFNLTKYPTGQPGHSLYWSLKNSRNEQSSSTNMPQKESVCVWGV